MAEVITEKASSNWSDLYKSEDYWAIWLGLIILVIGMLIFFPRPPDGMKESIAEANAVLQAESQRASFKTVEWFKANDTKLKLKLTIRILQKRLKPS